MFQFIINSIVIMFTMLIGCLGWSGIVGGIWALYIGELEIVLKALIFAFISIYLLSFLMTTTLLPTLLLGKFAEKSKLIKNILLVLTVPITPLIIALYGIIVIDFFYYKYLHTLPEFPLFLITLSLLAGPWKFFARKENTETAFISAFITGVIYFIVSILLFFIKMPLSTVFLIIFIGQLSSSIIIIKMRCNKLKLENEE